MNKWFKRGLIAIGILLFLATMLGIVIGFFYKDEVVRRLLEELNRNVDTRVSARSIDFSILRRFPRASVEFRDLLVEPAKDFNRSVFPGLPADTLLFARSVFLEFNVLDLVRGEYKIRRVVFQHGDINLFVDKQNKPNYRFWKEGEKEKSQDDRFELELRDLRLNRVTLRYADKNQQLTWEADARKLTLAGSFATDDFLLDVSADFYLDHLVSRDSLLLRDKEGKASTRLRVEKNKYTVDKGKLVLEGLELGLDGVFTAGSPSQLDLTLTGNQLELPSIQALLPKDKLVQLEPYQVKGVFSFEARAQGNWGMGQFPRVEAIFELQKGDILHRESKVRFTGISFKGEYSNGEKHHPVSSSVQLDQFEARVRDGRIQGSFKWSNFHAPHLAFRLKASTPVDDWHRFFGFVNLKELKANVEAEIDFETRLSGQGDQRVMDPTRTRAKGTVHLEGQRLVLDNGKVYKDINGDFKWDNNLYINKLYFVNESNDFTIKGEVVNFLPYILLKNQEIDLRADVYSKNLDGMSLVWENPNPKGKSRGDARFPERLKFQVNVKIDKFKFNRFSAKNVEGNVSYIPGKLVLNSIFLDSQGGKSNGGGVAIQHVNGNIILHCQARMHQLEIRELFYAFNNFGQGILVDKHLGGRLSGTVSMQSEWTSKLDLIPGALVVQSNLVIENGELIRFEPLLGLSRFIAVSELQDIKFSTLRNEIFIKDQKIIIPSMDIASSAINITGSGVHEFDNAYSYKIKVQLSELLSGKARRAKKENQEFGVIEDDGLNRTSLYLDITGKDSDYKISYDTRAAAGAVKEGLGRERQNLKGILHEEFGWFRGDTALGKSTSPKNPGFQVEWEEEQAPRQERRERKKKEETGTGEKFKVEWD